MKCILIKKEGHKNLGQFVRVTDAIARKLVEAGAADYVWKKAWKESGRHYMQ